MNEQKEWRPLPESITIKESKIEGLGVFATQDIQVNTDLGISHVYDERFPDNYIRLPLGAFINHHEMPNCKACLLYTSPSPRDVEESRMPSSA